MLILVCIAALLVGQLSPEVRARLEPFTTAVAEAWANMAALDHEGSVKTRLEAMRVLDQRPLIIANHEIDLSSLNEEDHAAAREAVGRLRAV